MSENIFFAAVREGEMGEWVDFETASCCVEQTDRKVEVERRDFPSLHKQWRVLRIAQFHAVERVGD